MRCAPFMAVLALAGAAHAEPFEPARAAGLVVSTTNAFRREHRLPALETNARLERAAREFARYMADTDRFGHTADGRQPSDRVKVQGYDYCMVAENIGYQYHSHGFGGAGKLADAFVDGWKNSAGHRRNLLERDAVETGVAVERSSRTGRYYAVQLFGRRAAKGHTCG